jgi:hypothetical protein
MGRTLVRLAFVVLFASFGRPVQAQDAIGVDVNSILADVSGRPIGINLNFLLDDDGNRPDALNRLADGLRAAGVKYLRYPGGEKADGYLWSVPPYTSSVPTLARWAPAEWPENTEWPSYDRALVNPDGFTFRTNPLSFDEFMDVCRQIDCVPTIVVCYDSIYKPPQPGGFAPSRATVLQAAREWVRYANLTRGYNVRYWEIGNESWLPHYNGQATAQDYARDLVEFSAAMKAIDPSIKIGANGESLDWWQTVLAGASAAIDFLAVHNYPPYEWGSYSYYQYNDPQFLDVVETARTAIARYARPSDRVRLEVAVTETNAADWSGAWPNVNDTGHALVLFDLFGRHLTAGVAFTQLWNTRWSGADTAPMPRVIDTFDSNNNPQATGSALALWGRFLKERMVASTSTARVRTYASYSPGDKTLTVFLINKDTASRDVAVRIDNLSASIVANKWIFKGTDADDVHPSLEGPSSPPANANVVSTSLDPVSITVLTIAPAPTAPAASATIEAENFDAYWDESPENEGGEYRSSGVDIERTSDSGGGYNVGWIAGGEWLEYAIAVESAGEYRLSLRVASPVDHTTFRVLIDGIVVGDLLTVPNTGSWQSWSTLATRSVRLNAGTHRVRVHTDTGWFNLNWIRIEPPQGQSSITIEAEDFDWYWDWTEENEGGEYRSTGVDIERTADEGGGFNVGWIFAGEWLEYTIRVDSGATFALDARVASIWSGTSLRVEIDGLVLGAAVEIPNTGSWQSWQTVHTSARLDTGVHRVRISTDTGGFNLNKLVFHAPPQ